MIRIRAQPRSHLFMSRFAMPPCLLFPALFEYRVFRGFNLDVQGDFIADAG